MGIFTKEIGTVFLNESKRVEEFIVKLRELEISIPDGALKNEIKGRINLEKSGLDGEHAVIYSLKNSRKNMYVIHDLNIGSQIDFLIISSKQVYVVECKNWKGNIEVSENGDFYVYEDKKTDKTRKRYKSPTSQNEEHLRAVKDLLVHSKSNIFNKKRIEEEYEKRYCSLVVFTNTSSVIDTSKARVIDSKPVVHIDQLIRRINDIEASIKDNMSIKQMKELADFFIENNHPDIEKYEKEYHVYWEKVRRLKEEIANIEKPKKEDEELEKQLRHFRTFISKQKNIKPYIVFNDKSMRELVSKRPITKEELLSIEGFGEKKLQDYGEKILKIINE